MDGQVTTQQGRRGDQILISLAALFALLPAAVGQRRDLTPREPEVFTHFSLDQNRQAFPPAVWEFRNSSPRGAVISWELRPFTNAAAPQQQLDADVRVRLVQASTRGRWRATRDYASTNFQQGRDAAIVNVAADGRGQGVAELLVRMVTPRPQQVASGAWQSTLTGTISGP